MVDSYKEVPLLTVIVPITRMHGKMENLFSWLNDVNAYECEVILIHDWQDQETSRELQQYVHELNSSKVHFFEGRFGSPGLARNFGKRYATGTHIMFCDSDDVLQLPSTIEIIRKNSGSKIIIGSYVEVNSLSTQQVVKHLAPVNLLKLAKAPGMWRFIFKSEVIKNIDFTEYCMGEDQLFLAQVDVFSQDFLCVSETLYLYFTNNPDQLTAQKARTFDLIPVIRRMIDLEIQFRKQNKTFIKLLILKNCITVLKNSRHLRVDSKRKVLLNFSWQFVKMTLTLNWYRVFRFEGRLE
jgi:glycosyltransferase involved in cell wall biosynthesis